MENVYYDVNFKTMEREGYKTPIEFYRITENGNMLVVEELDGKYWRHSGLYKGEPLDEVLDTRRVRKTNKEIIRIMQNPYEGEPVVVE